MKITIEITSTEPIYPFVCGISDLEDFLSWVNKNITADNDERGDYPRGEIGTSCEFSEIKMTIEK